MRLGACVRALLSEGAQYPDSLGSLPSDSAEQYWTLLWGAFDTTGPGRARLALHRFTVDSHRTFL
ncbi:MAG: hypothetical protein ABIR54_09765 [Burkholderiaceae bacterium]